MNRVINHLIRVIIIFFGLYYYLNDNVKATKLLMLVLFITFIPWLIKKFFNFEFSIFSRYLLIAVCFASILFGTINNFYYLYPHFDLLIHLGAGIMFADIAFSLYSQYQIGKPNLLLMIILTIAFSMLMSCLWEIFEYSLDYIKGTNHQHWRGDYEFCRDLYKGTIIPNGLRDTMMDLIANLVGALCYQIKLFFKTR